MQHANLTSHDITQKVELHRYTEEVVYKRGLNGIHTLFPLNTEPILTPANSLLHHICYTKHNLDQAKLKSPNTVKPVFLLFTLTVTASCSLHYVLLLGAVGRMDRLLTKRVISVLTHYLIPNLLELSAHILRLFLKYFTVILSRKVFMGQISKIHIGKLYIHTLCQVVLISLMKTTTKNVY